MRRVVQLLTASATIAAASASTLAGPFVTLPREDGGSHVDLQTSLLPVKLGDSNGVAIRLDPHLEFALQHRIALFANVAMTALAADGENNYALTNATLGVDYSVDTERPTTDLILSAAAMLPTASTLPERVTANEISSIARLSDYLASSPAVLAMRVHGTVIYRHDDLVAQAGLGLDLGVLSRGSADLVARIRVAAGVGRRFGPTQVGAEFAAVYTADTPDDSWLSTVALGARLTGRTISPYAAVLLPLDGPPSGIVPVVFTVGVELVAKHHAACLAQC